jgi:hypothetical protein
LDPPAITALDKTSIEDISDSRIFAAGAVAGGMGGTLAAYGATNALLAVGVTVTLTNPIGISALALACVINGVGGRLVGGKGLRALKDRRHRQEQTKSKGLGNLREDVKHMGYGVGDDDESWGLDLDGGIWHSLRKLAFGSNIEQGDTIGCACDIEEGVISFSLNGSWDPPFGQAVKGLRLDSGVRPAVTLGRGAKIRVNFGEGPFAFHSPTIDFRPVVESSSTSPKTVFLQTSCGRLFGRLCSGCKKIAEPITCSKHAVVDVEGSTNMNLKGALAVVHFDHDLLSLHHINTYLQESVAAILIVSTGEENGERLVDFGVDPPVSFDIPIITMSHTSGRRLDGHAGKICIGMACDLTSMTQRFKDATGAGEEMATFFCTDALEHGLTWEHAANAYNENQREKKQNMRLAVAISGSDAGAGSDVGAAAGAGAFNGTGSGAGVGVGVGGIGGIGGSGGSGDGASIQGGNAGSNGHATLKKLQLSETPRLDPAQ